MQKAVMLEVREEVLYLRYDINSIIQGEEDAGISLTTEQKPTFAVMRGMLYAGLLWNNNQMTLRKAGDILQSILEEKGVEEGSKYLADRITKANNLAFGKKLEAPQKIIPQNQIRKTKKNKNRKNKN